MSSATPSLPSSEMLTTGSGPNDLDASDQHRNIDLTAFLKGKPSVRASVGTTIIHDHFVPHPARLQFHSSETADTDAGEKSVQVVQVTAGKQLFERRFATPPFSVASDTQIPASKIIKEFAVRSDQACDHCGIYQMTGPGRVIKDGFGVYSDNPTVEFFTDDALMTCTNGHGERVPSQLTVHDPSSVISFKDFIASRKWDCQSCGTQSSMTPLSDRRFPVGSAGDSSEQVNAGDRLSHSKPY
ncbi:hypothetical protein V865_005912 [Kwoniella europaea PYCC6329]|uniref:Uncharacterized protein n=1 Tax=Kwoniella europaea PYCC6329 TaxID=1423913 RepID=A0AAX4KR38_9TREE